MNLTFVISMENILKAIFVYIAQNHNIQKKWNM